MFSGLDYLRPRPKLTAWKREKPKFSSIGGMVANLEPVRRIRGRFGFRRIGWRFDEFGISESDSEPFAQDGPGRFLVKATGRQPTTKKLSMDSMEPSMEPSSQSHNDKGFEWNPGMMCNKSNHAGADFGGCPFLEEIIGTVISVDVVSYERKASLR